MGWESRRKRDRWRGSSRKAPATAVAPESTPPALPTGPLSEALVLLVDPYLHEATTLASYTALIGVGVLAWNVASFPEDEREEQLVETIQGKALPDPHVLCKMARTLSRRKDELFPNDRRMILDYKVTRVPTGYHVTIISAHSA